MALQHADHSREYEAGAAHLERKASVGHVEPAVGLHSSRHLCCTLYAVACHGHSRHDRARARGHMTSNRRAAEVTGVKIATHVDGLCDVPGLVSARAITAASTWVS